MAIGHKTPNKKFSHRLGLWLTAVVSLLSSLILALSPILTSQSSAKLDDPGAYAVTSDYGKLDNLNDIIYADTAYFGLKWCLTNLGKTISFGSANSELYGLSSANSWNGDRTLAPADITSLKWFGDNAWAPGGYILGNPNGSNLHSLDHDADGQIKCNDILAAGMKLWGLDAMDLICSASYDNGSTLKREDGSDCQNSASTSYLVVNHGGSLAKDAAAVATDILSKVLSTYYGGVEPMGNYNAYTGAYTYVYYRAALVNSMGCQATSAATQSDYDNAGGDDSSKNKTVYAVPSFQSVTLESATATAKVTSTLSYDFGRNKDQTAWADFVWANDYNTSRPSCKDIESKVLKFIPDYTTYLENHPDETPKSGQHASTACQETNSCPSQASSCTVAQVGWIVCPIMNMMGGALDGLFNLLGGMLTVSPKFVAGANDSWRTILGFANAGLVIIFLIIIFSQITSIGIGNYGIKKMLPRLIVAAIVIQISMWLVSLAVDLSNILGNGIYGVLNDTSNTVLCIPNTDGSGTNANGTVDCGAGQSAHLGSDPNASTTGGGVILIVGTIIASTALVGALMWGALGLLIPVVLAGLLAVAITLGILIARLVIIILLLVLAPVAILAMVLPNTESLFKTWRKWLVSMLLLFPMVALLFGGAKLAAGIWATAGTTAGVGSWLGGFFGAIIELAILFLPLFFTPKLLQGSLSAIPAIGNMATKLASKSNGGVSKSASNLAKNTDVTKAWQARQAGLQKSRDKKSEARLGNRKLLRGIAQSQFLKDERKEGGKIVDAAATRAASRAISEKLSTMPVSTHGEALRNMAAEGITKDRNGKQVATAESSAAMTRMLQNGHLSDFSKLLKNPDTGQAASQLLDRFNSARAEANMPGINMDTILGNSSSPQGSSNNNPDNNNRGSGPGGMIMPGDPGFKP